MKAKIKTDCQLNGKFYSAGEDIEVENIKQLSKLNELGFIEPLSPKQIQEFFK